MASSDAPLSPCKRIFLLGATGTIGQAVAKELIQRGHELVCFVRPKSKQRKTLPDALHGATIRFGEVTNRRSLEEDGFCGEQFDTVISCMASRTGVEKEAWAIDYQANQDALELGQALGISQMVLLSAICVQKPKLAFQKAKLAFEKSLIASGLAYSIVRPTAFFKSLSGQVDRVRSGKSYMMFGDGEITACKPISDSDLARFIGDCLENEDKKNKILPIGGPGPAITPKQQGEYLFSATGREPKYQSVNPKFLLTVAKLLSTVGWIVPPLKARAEYARIGHYYATESMLVLDESTGEYREDLTPTTGTETLFEHYRRLLEEND